MRTVLAAPLVAAAFACALLSPGLARAADDAARPIPTSDLRPLHALSLFGHGMFAPNALLSVALQQSTELTSGGFGMAYTYRRGTLDIVTSLDFSFVSPPDGNYLGVGKDAAIDTHYVQFRNLNFLSLDVSFYWVRDMSRYVAFMIGGGIGIGAVLGDVMVTNNSNMCTKANAGNVQLCNPFVDPRNYTMNGAVQPPDPPPQWKDASNVVHAFGTYSNGVPTGGEAIVPGSANFQDKLNGLQQSQADCKSGKGTPTGMPGADCRDTALHPYTHVASEKPPVMVVINIQIGLKFKLHRHFNLNIMGGFRDGLVVGGGPEVVF